MNKGLIFLSRTYIDIGGVDWFSFLWISRWYGCAFGANPLRGFSWNMGVPIWEYEKQIFSSTYPPGKAGLNPFAFYKGVFFRQSLNLDFD